MTKQIYSISALAVELGRDRRTVASALDRVVPDGIVKGGPHRGWYLQTALKALKAEPPKPFDPTDGPLGTMLDRLAGWREIYSGEPPDLSIQDMAVIIGHPASSVLTWLRAGLPYVKRGDFETGAGFTLRAPWLIDWLCSTSFIARKSGDSASAAKLKLLKEFT
ncbi:hypothetical protein LB516_24010 [Mesorhizobium sp. CO1-1-7]|uniref:hypothetical protein n=1 Tax=Mesorhizobium sp. CO1-1-7 TaxID=2876632 RepID=UPI001CD05A3A|nr:hypothetical protein [Mesorhizobium sp. CO1-1-7]MBZ9748300.1 hypothetical protein [Mesorhizobium sp. CO1-1-7]